MILDVVRNGYADSPAMMIVGVILLIGACVACLAFARATLRSKRAPRVFAKLVMLSALGWSAEVMFHIVRVDLKQGWGPTIAMFAVFEAAFLLAADRAERHMVAHEWPGLHLRTVAGIAVVMSCVGLLVSHSAAERLIRVTVPLVAVKVWRDGLYDGRESRPAVSSWLWTPRNLAIWVGALRPGDNDVSAVSRERIVSRMVRLEFTRRHGTEKQRARVTSRLMRLSLRADESMVREARARVDRAQWFTVTPLRGMRSAPAEAAQRPAQVLTRPGAQPAHKTADAATQAAQLFQSGEYPSIRAAARQHGVSEGTVRNRLARMGGEVAQIPAQPEPVAA